MSVEVRISPSGPAVPLENAGGRPMSSVMFVDAATPVPLAAQTGSAIAPFASVQDAIDALAPAEGGTILITSGDYTDEALTSDFGIVFRNLGDDQIASVALGSFTGPGGISLSLYYVGIESVSGVESLEAVGASFDSVGTVDVENIVAIKSVFDSALVADSYVLEDCIFTATVTVAVAGTLNAFKTTFEDALTGLASSVLTLRECVTAGITGRTISIDGGSHVAVTAITQTVGSLTLANTRIGGLVSASNANIRSSFLGDVVTATILAIDKSTLYTALVAGVPPSVGGALNVLDNASASVSVTVPAVAADEVGYVNVSMVGTPLANIPVGAPIQVNPRSDLVAAGPGGGFVNARVFAEGSIRCVFVGALAGGAVNMTFSRI